MQKAMVYRATIICGRSYPMGDNFMFQNENVQSAIDQWNADLRRAKGTEFDFYAIARWLTPPVKG